MKTDERLEYSKKAIRDGRFDEAIELLRPLVAIKNLEGTSFTSSVYLLLEQYEKAFEYAMLTLKIDENDITANGTAGAHFYHGFGGVTDDAKAFVYYKRAADQGDFLCSARVGNMYENGEGIELNYELARKYYKFSGSNGHVLSNFLISTTYFKEFKILKGLYYFLRYIVPLKIAQARKQVEMTTFY